MPKYETFPYSVFHLPVKGPSTYTDSRDASSKFIIRKAGWITSWNDLSTKFELPVGVYQHVPSKMNKIIDELNGHFEAEFILPNTPDNQTLVSEDHDMQVLWSHGMSSDHLVYDVTLKGATFERAQIKALAYDSCYEGLVGKLYTATHDKNDTAAVILKAIGDRAGVPCYVYPGFNKVVNVRFDHTDCLMAAKYVARCVGGDYWTENGIFCIGNRGGAVVEFDFEEGSGASLKDLSRTGNAGMIIGSGWAWTTGKYGTGLYADGSVSSNCISVPHSESMKSSSLTVALWYKPEDGGYIADKRAHGNYGWSIVQNTNGTVTLEVWTGGSSRTDYLTSPAIFTFGEWHHIGCVFKSSGYMAIFHDGVEVANKNTSASGIEHSSANLHLAYSLTGAEIPPQQSGIFSGTLDAFHLYNVALTDNQVKNIFNVPLTAYPERTLDRTQQFNHVFVRGYTSSGTAVTGEAKSSTWTDATDRAIAFTDKQASGTAQQVQETLNGEAEAYLKEYNTDSGGTPLKVTVLQSFDINPGNTIGLIMPDIAMNGEYKVWRVTKELGETDVEVDKPQILIERALTSLKNLESQGIYQIPMQTTIEEWTETNDPPTGYVGQLIYKTTEHALKRCTSAGPPATWITVVQTSNSGSALPTTGYLGDLYYRTSTGKMYRCTKTQCTVTADWQIMSSVSTSGPYASMPATGDMVGEWYYCTDTAELWRWTGSAWEKTLQKVRQVSNVDDLYDPGFIANPAVGDTVYVTAAAQTFYCSSISPLTWIPLATISHQGTTTARLAYSSGGNAAIGDIWYDTTESKFYRWTAGTPNYWDFIATNDISKMDNVADVLVYTDHDNAERHTASMLRKGIQPYTCNITFTATSSTSVSWSAGNIRFADGTSQSISAGSVGSPLIAVGVISYLYFDLDSSPTVIKTTQDYTVVAGSHKGLLAMASGTSDSSSEAYVQPFLSKGLNINADMIAANTIVANHIKALSIETDKIQIGAVNTDQIHDNAITTAKILNGQVNHYKFKGQELTIYSSSPEDWSETGWHELMKYTINYNVAMIIWAVVNVTVHAYEYGPHTGDLQVRIAVDGTAKRTWIYHIDDTGGATHSLSLTYVWQQTTINSHSITVDAKSTVDGELYTYTDRVMVLYAGAS